MSVLNVTAADFEELVLKSSKPVLVDFWAPWCGPCKMVGPILEAIAADRDDIIVAKINVDDEQELASLFRIRSVPTLVFAPMKGDPHITSGAPTKAQLREALDSFIAS